MAVSFCVVGVSLRLCLSFRAVRSLPAQVLDDKLCTGLGHLMSSPGWPSCHKDERGLTFIGSKVVIMGQGATQPSRKPRTAHSGCSIPYWL